MTSIGLFQVSDITDAGGFDKGARGVLSVASPRCSLRPDRRSAIAVIVGS